jgi:hypothetical protein
VTMRRQLAFLGRLSLDSQADTVSGSSEVDSGPQTPSKPHFNPFTDFVTRISIPPPSSTFLSIPRRFSTTTLQTYHATTARVPTFRALTTRITRRRRVAVVLATLAVFILLAIVMETAPPTLKSPKSRTWKFDGFINNNIDAAFAPASAFGPSHKRTHPYDLVLEREQELGGLVAFMTALTSNMLPSDINPSEPLDPQLVVGFDTRADNAKEELQALVEETWLNNPVVIFSQVSRNCSNIEGSLIKSE